jgi:hypothetical protein
MDKSKLKELLIEWLNNPNDVNKTLKFIYHWVKYKMPELDENRLNEFINKLYQSIMIPSFFSENPSIIAINHLSELAKIELEVNTIVKTEDYNQIIKYY